MPSFKTAVGFGIAAEVLKPVDTLILASEEGPAAGRSFKRNQRSVDDGVSACRIVENGCVQLRTIRIGQQQSADSGRSGARGAGGYAGGAAGSNSDSSVANVAVRRTVGLVDTFA